MCNFKKSQGKIIFMVVLALVLQIAAPVIGGYSFAEEKKSQENIEIETVSELEEDNLKGEGESGDPGSEEEEVAEGSEDLDENEELEEDQEELDEADDGNEDKLEAESDDSQELEGLKKEDTGKAKVELQANGEEKCGFVLKLGEVTDLDDKPFNDDNLLDPKDEFKLKLDWEIKDDCNYKNGDIVEFYLPEGIKIQEKFPIELNYGPLRVANAVVHTDRKVVMTFTDFVENHSNVEGYMKIISKIDEENAEVEGGEIILQPIGEEGEIRIPVDLGERKKTIDKEGTPNKKYKADEINWSVTINKMKNNLTNARVTDVLPTGTKYKDGSLKVTKLKVGLNGNVLGDLEDVDITGGILDEYGNLDIPLGDIKDAYRIEYITTVTDDDQKTFENNAILSDEDLDDVPAKITVTINRGDPIKKSAVTAYNPKTGIIEWEIEFNFNQKDLDDLTLKDAWTPKGKMHLVKDSLKFQEVRIDDDANVHNEGVPINLPKGATLVKGEDQFEVTGITTDKAYRVTYQTKVNDRVLEGFEIKNTAGFGTESTGSGTGVGSYYGSKSAGNVDYKNKTIDWTIEINHDEYTMKEISILDTLGDGLTLDKSSIEITVDGKTYNKEKEGDYTVSDGNPFELKFPEEYTTDKKIVIKYKTSFIADDLPLEKDENQHEKRIAKNEAKITWTPGGGGDSITKDVKAQTPLNKATKENHWKSGLYNPATKEITWTIYTNYRENSIGNLIVKDKPQGNQKVVEGSAVVTELEILGDGTTKDSGVLGESVSTFNIANNSLTVNIGETKKAYRIEYKTSLADLDVIQKEYVNKAEVFDGTTLLLEIDAKVGIAKAHTYGEKSGQQDGKQVHWSITVNPGQQKVKGLKLVDEISPNQDYLTDTFKVYEATVDVEGNAKRGEVLSADKYTFTHTDGELTFTVEWKNNVDRAFIVEYSTLFFEKHGEEVTNKYEVTGEHSFEDDNEDKTGKVKIVQMGLGGATGTAGYLIIDKVDATYEGNDESLNYPKLEGAEFDLIDADTGKILKSGITDKNGQIDFGRLLFGNYELHERVVPDNYVTKNEKQKITINKKYDPVTGKEKYVYEVENYIPVYQIDLTKVDDIDEDRFIKGAKFGLYNSNNKEIATATTNEKGKIFFELTGENKKPGVYYVKEIIAAGNYELNDKKYYLIIGDKEQYPKELTVRNSLIKGKGSLKKVDAENLDIGLEGAVFEVLDGNTVVDTVTTNSDGTATTKELRPGTYIVKEKTAPKGFTNSGEEKILVIPEADEVSTIEIGTFKNQVKTTDLELTKKDSINGKQLLPGAKFKLKYKEGNYALKESPVIKTTDDEGKIKFEDLKPGMYEIKEKTTPEGYISKGESWVDTVEVKLDDVHRERTVKKEVKNDPLANVIVHKQDRETDYKLKGAEFSVTKDGDSEPVRKKLTTNSKGQISITGLTAGKYTLTETKAPTGYKKDSTPQTFEVEAGVTTTKVIEKTFKNDIIKGSVELIKIDGDDVDADDNNTPLKGVEFSLKATSLVNGGTYEATKHITDADGEISIENLRPGKYKFTETKTLEGYQPHWKDITFEIKLQDEVQKIEFTGEDAIVNYQLVDIPVVKKWNDLWTEDANPGRPDEIKVNLLQNNTKLKEGAIRSTDDWKYTFEGLDAVDSNGDRYDYTVKEKSVKGYNSDVTGDLTDGFTVKNTAKSINLKLIKQDSINTRQKLKDAEFTLTYPDGTTTEVKTTNENGELTFIDLQPGKYTIAETKTPAGYIGNNKSFEVEVTLDKVEGVGELTKTIENAPFADVQFKKVDADTRVGLPGAEFKVVDNDGKDVDGYTGLKVKDDGTLSITGLSEGSYKLVETKAPTGYKVNEDGMEFNVAAGSETDVKEEEYENEIEKGSVTLIKKDEKGVLKDVEFTLESISLVNSDGTYKETHKTDADGKIFVENLRPGKYKFTETFPDGYQKYIGKDLRFTIDPTKDGKTDIDLGDVTNHKLVDIEVTKEWKDDNNSTKERPEKITVDLFRSDNLDDPYESKDITGEGNNWTHTFEGLDAVDSNGKKYTYTIREQEVNGYTSSRPVEINTGFKITNTRVGKVDVEGRKYWKDGNSETRPEGVTIKLLANGEKVGDTKATKDNDWSYEFKNLEAYDDNGIAVKYTVVESEVEGYKLDNINGYNITNVRTGKTEVKGTKVWLDGNSKDRPEVITVNLLANGKKTDESIEVKGKSDVSEWAYEFKNLEKYDDEGIAIEYTVEEVEETGYQSSVNGYEITNLRVGKTDIEVEKTWIGPKAEEVEITLYADEEATNETLILNEENEWKGSFTNLDKYNKTDGDLIVYTVVERDVENNDSVVTGSMEDGFTVINTNTEKTNIEVNKDWIGPKATEVEIKLYADGKATEETLVLNEENEWKGSFANLDKYNKTDGELIEYTVVETEIKNYNSNVTGTAEDGLTVTNTYVSPKTEITGTKVWVDGPETKPTIELQLFKDGKALGKPVTLKSGETEYTWTDLDLTDKDGVEYKYTVDEVNIPENYKKSISEDGITITNKYEKPSVPPVKPTDPPKEDDKSGLPAAGESSNIVFYIGGLLLIVLGLAFRRKTA